MNFIQSLVDKLQRHPKRFVFPDGEDARVLQAARQIVSRKMGVPVVIGDRSNIKAKASKLGLASKGIRIVEIARSSDLDSYAAQLKAMPRYAALPDEEISTMITDPNVFSTLMMKQNQVDAMISGASARASSALRPLFRIIGTREEVTTASSSLILELEAKRLGIDGSLFMGDCGVIPDPDVEQLASIAISTAGLAYHLTGVRPKVAMLSFATHARTKRPQTSKVYEATQRVKERADTLDFPIEVEGELQVDAALDRATAIVKGLEGGNVAGNANVLIFPDLNSGNIASKLVQILTGADTYGQIIMGLNRPAAEISRGSTAHDILGAAAIVGCQAIDRGLLFNP